MSFRLLVISGAFPPIKAPESAHTLFLCEQLARRGLDVHLLTSQRAGAGAPGLDGLRVYPLMTDWRWRRLPTLARMLRTLRPDAVLLIYIDWIYGCHPMITFSPSLARRLLPDVPFITQFENEDGLSGGAPPSGLRAWLARTFATWALAGRPRGLHASYGALLHDSTKIIALSERHLEAFEQARPGVQDKATVIPAPPIMRIVAEDAANSARWRGRAQLGVSGEEFLLAYFGYVYPTKGIETLLRAFAMITAVGGEALQVRLVIIGGSLDPAYFDRLKRLAEEGTGAGRIIWPGHCEPDEVASICLRAADLCVLPFDAGVRLNNSSFAVAAAHGLPIVTTRGEILEPAFVDGENVCLCPPRDPPALAAILAELLANPARRERLRAGARQLAQEHFSWDRVVNATLQVLGARLPEALSTR